TTPRNRAIPRPGALASALFATALLSACVVEAPPRYVQAPPRPVPVYQQPAANYARGEDPGVGVYVSPPREQPAPIAVQWAPPPMLVEVPPPQPYPDAVWTGGYWAWEGRWFWSAGRWSRPPHPDYRWQQPYYEHRGDKVVYVPAYWSPPQHNFIAPAVGIAIAAAVIAIGVHAG